MFTLNTQFTHNSYIITYNSLKTMSHSNSSDNKSVYNTPPEDLFPVFPYDNQPQNYPPQDLFPVFPYDNPPVNTPPKDIFLVLPTKNEPVNTPPGKHQPNPFNFTEEQPQKLEQDEEILREIQETEAREATT